MNSPAHSVWLHRFAWLTAALTLLLPVTTGAMVTTLKAGMVFSDWPSSDGYSFWSYPWLSSARDQFVEHGHRLSGGTIGLVCLLMAIAAWFLDQRLMVRSVATAILIAVIAQAALGAARVLLDKQTLALVHGDFAALVFTLMSVLILITSKGWESRSRFASVEDFQSVSNVATLLLASLIAQYLMGGFLRHLREREEFAWAWMVHPWFALVVLFVTLLFVFAVRGSDSLVLRRFGTMMIMLTVAQSLIGLATWYVRYGVPEWGVVAEQDSLPQVIICSLHKVVGMLTLMTSALSVFCCWSVKPLQVKQPAAVGTGTSVAGVVT